MNEKNNENVCRLADEELGLTSGGRTRRVAEVNQASGMHCPSCGASIERDIAVRLAGGHMPCPNCSSEITIDASSGKIAIFRVRK